jgi:hypothetical protein
MPPPLSHGGLQSSPLRLTDIPQEAKHIQQVGLAARIGANKVGHIAQRDVSLVEVAPVSQDQSLNEHFALVLAFGKRTS